MATTKRTRRGEEELIRDLEAKIASIKTRAARKAAKSKPTMRYTAAALKNVDKALDACDDVATKYALQEARTILTACLRLDGVVVAHGTTVRNGARVSPDQLLDYVMQNPAQRGEQISAALGTDTKSIRSVMQKLIAERKVKTKGYRRAMTYAAV